MPANEDYDGLTVEEMSAIVDERDELKEQLAKAQQMLDANRSFIAGLMAGADALRKDYDAQSVTLRQWANDNDSLKMSVGMLEEKVEKLESELSHESEFETAFYSHQRELGELTQLLFEMFNDMTFDLGPYQERIKRLLLPDEM